jgi:hypothetical protein
MLRGNRGKTERGVGYFRSRELAFLTPPFVFVHAVNTELHFLDSSSRYSYI